MIDPESIGLLFENAKSGTDAENAEIVLDLLSFSYRIVFTQSPSFHGNPYQELAKALIKAPTEPTQEGLPQRLAFIEAALKHLQVDGVVIAEQSFCDPDQFEVPAILAITEKEKIPIVRLPLDPEFSDRARLEGRLQSFLETITK
jgi:benzoyl-CoA reductase/2-hydroxyglutaryl-CoA dehydratase subunit BcrC/BadD/HgdB